MPFNLKQMHHLDKFKHIVKTLGAVRPSSY